MVGISNYILFYLFFFLFFSLSLSIGVEHTDDLNYIIYRSDTTPEYNETDNEHKMVESMTRIWENFAYNRYSEKCLMI
jgi:hypothetical protein